MIEEDRIRDVVALLKSCGVNPKDVPRDTEISLVDDEVFLERFVRNWNGAIAVDDKRQVARTEGFSVKPPPELIPDWLRNL
jgi:hypothetical protein